MAQHARFRIGELSRRVDVTPELLRAWEARYGLLNPERTPGGLRLFSEKDEERVRRMCAHIEAGIPASEAARLVKLEDDLLEADTWASAAGLRRQGLSRQLEDAVAALDEPAAQSALDALFQALPLERALSEVIIPFLNIVGERWAASETSVAQEHFASNVIGARLRGRTRGWGAGVGPLAVLACPPGERHDLGLLCFGLALREHGWRIVYLGADTPLGEITTGLGKLSPTVVVLCATAPGPLVQAHEEILALRGLVRVAVGGAGASAELAKQLGFELLAGDPVSEAAALRP